MVLTLALVTTRLAGGAGGRSCLARAAFALARALAFASLVLSAFARAFARFALAVFALAFADGAAPTFARSDAAPAIPAVSGISKPITSPTARTVGTALRLCRR
jgi:hypothetical protein